MTLISTTPNNGYGGYGMLMEVNFFANFWTPKRPEHAAYFLCQDAVFHMMHRLAADLGIDHKLFWAPSNLQLVSYQ